VIHLKGLLIALVDHRSTDIRVRDVNIRTNVWA